jgi:hypothetical protein
MLLIGGVALLCAICVGLGFELGRHPWLFRR